MGVGAWSKCFKRYHEKKKKKVRERRGRRKGEGMGGAGRLEVKML